MKLQEYLFLPFVLVLVFHSEGLLALQSFDSLALAKRKSIEKEMLLLANQNDLLPLQRLDTLRIMSLHIGAHSEVQHNRVNTYKASACFSGDDFNRLSDVNANLIIAGVDATFDKYEELRSFFLTKKEKSRIVLLIEQDTTLLHGLGGLAGVSALVMLPAGGLSFDLAVQGVFGAIGFKGQRQAHASGVPKFKFGILTEPLGRMKYTIPEELGISSEQLDKGISAVVGEALNSLAFPGCQVLVAKSGKVIYQKSFGCHTYDKKRRVKNTDLFDLASVSKVTGAATALMKLYDEGKFKLDKPFVNYWPDLKGSSKAQSIVRQVLAHHARWKPYIVYYAESRRKNGKYRWNTIKSDSSRRFPIRVADNCFLHKDYKEKKIYKMIRKSPLQQPGYRYSGLSFYLYPEIVKSMTGLDYDQYLHKEFFDPLGASTLCFNPLERFPKERIVPTENDDFFRMQQLQGTVHDEGAAMMAGVSGNAGLFSTANDLAKVWQMYLNGGSYGGKQYIEQSTIREWTRCQYCEQGNRRGLAFDKPLIEYDSLKSSVAKRASAASYGHSGYTGTLVWADPEEDLLFIFLSNRVHTTRENRKIYQLNIRPRIHHAIYAVLKQE